MVPTNDVTEVEAGSMLTITIDERIFHPGHYRVAIANDLASLPDDPPVTAGSTPCGSTVIDPNPTLPVLADGLLVHTTSFNGQQTVQVPIPSDLRCTNCVLQVIEFMSNHGLNNPGGCFYHHCATVSVVAPGTPDAGVPEDAGPGDDAGFEDAATADADDPDGTPADTGRLDTGGGDTGGGDTGAPDTGAPDSGQAGMGEDAGPGGSPDTGPSTREVGGGCGCNAAEQRPGGNGAPALVGLLGVVLLRRRRKR